MKVIPQTRHSHYNIYLRFYLYIIMNVPDEGYSTKMSFTLQYISLFLFISYNERTWWRLFHKHVIHTTLAIFISYFYFTMSAPDEGYSTNTSFTLQYIYPFLLLFYYERTWWRLFHKHVIHTTLAIFISIFISLWAHLMKVIPQTCHPHYIS